MMLGRSTGLLMCVLVLSLFAVVPARAQFSAKVYTLTDAERQELEKGRDELGAAIVSLKSKVSGNPVVAARVPDAEIYFDAVDRNLRLGQFFSAKQVDQARACLKEGRSRVEALSRGETPWTRATGTVIYLGHRSEVDGTAQPFAVYVPAGYPFDDASPKPLDIFLHGRGGNLNELTFLSSGTGWLGGAFGKATPANLVLHPYGRGNNGWRFAGERDLYESLAAVKALYPIDADRISLRGFSMGGHGAWHIGLHDPGAWSVVAPGAGFIDTKQYLKITTKFPEWQDALLHMYDAIDVAFNARNVPFIAYCGDRDPKFDQHQMMVAALKRHGAPWVSDVVGKNTEHKYEPGDLSAMMGQIADARREPEAASVEFATYTTRFPQCKWVRIEGMERHWDRAEVRARRDSSGHITVGTTNVSSVTLSPAAAVSKVTIDGTELAVSSSPVTFSKRDGKWAVGELVGVRKTHGLSGPIDDALFGPVLAVKGTGQAWSADAAKWTDLELRRFHQGFNEYFRGRLPERADGNVTPDDVKSNNLYLFGDPGSNAYLRAILPKLPIEWTKDKLVVAGKTYSTADHLPMLVFPNPQNPSRYVVINCGFSFSRADWEGSNARQFAHLPDWAVIRFDAEKFGDDRSKDTVAAGFFDERWGMGKQ